MAKKPSINPDLEKAISELLSSSKDQEIDIRLKIIDRAINLEKLKQKVSDDEWGSGFKDDEDV
jgi:UDP-N-acetylmuramyl tripeptide synthase